MNGLQFAFPFFSVQCTKTGEIFQASEVEAMVQGLTTGQNQPTDLFLMSHGWNNNADDAKNLYSAFTTQLATQIQRLPNLKGRICAVAGVLWPSKKFEDQDLIPGGAASLNDSVTEAKLTARIQDLKTLCSGTPGIDAIDAEAEKKLTEVANRVDAWEEDPEVRLEVVRLIRDILSPGSAHPEDASDRFFSLKDEVLLEMLSRSLTPPPNVPQGSNAASLDPCSTGTTIGLGGAAGFRDVLGGIKGAFMHLLNFTTYYLMKDRAGKVGINGVKPLFEKIRTARPELRIHVMGHSFGCRVVTMATSSLVAPNADKRFYPNTMTLLQGAFSHNGFAKNFDSKNNDGAFRQVIDGKKVQGPILISHTRRDKAVGVAYPIASRIAGQTASALGDENDIFGGLGSNGAQTQNTTPERVTGDLLQVDGVYPFRAGTTASKPYNLKADNFIFGHSDIVKPEVAYAVAVAIATPDAT